MSVILGIVNKRVHSGFDEDTLSGFRDCLSLGGQRKVYSLDCGKAMFYCADHPDVNQNLIARDERNAQVTVFGGRILEYRGADKAAFSCKPWVDPALFCLEGFSQSGVSFLKGLNGTFGVALWDKRKERLILAGDTFGLYPLFYYDSNEIFIFCSEYQPILKYKELKPVLDPQAVAKYFIFGAVMGERTLIKGVLRLPPASALTLKDGLAGIDAYEHVDIHIQRDRPKGYFIERFEDRLRHVVTSGLSRFDIDHCDLSGGLDTRFILGLIPVGAAQGLKFITYMNAYLDEKTDRNVICAKRLSRQFKLRHNVIAGTKPVDFSPYFFERIRYVETNNPALSGRGGGEFLGGEFIKIYNQFFRPSNDPGQLRRQLLGYFSKRFVNSLGCLEDLLVRRLNSKEALARENTVFLSSVELIFRSFLSSLYYGSFRGTAFTCPWECFLGTEFSPFTDKEFLKLIAITPPEYLMDYGLYIAILKRHHRNLLKLPYFSCACRHPGIRHFGPGRHTFMRKENRHIKFINTCIKDPDAWVKQNLICRQKAKSHLRYYHSVRDLFDQKMYELAKVTDFQAWLNYIKN